MALGIWSDKEVKLLLNLLRDQKVAKYRNPSKCIASVFNKLSADMKNSGYTRSAKQIRNKLKGLRRSYFRSKDSIWFSENQRGGCRYYKDLDALFGHKSLQRSSQNEICASEAPEDNLTTDSGSTAIHWGNDVVTTVSAGNEERNTNSVMSVSNSENEVVHQLQVQLYNHLEKGRVNYQKILQRILENEDKLQVKEQEREKRMASIVAGILSLCQGRAI